MVRSAVFGNFAVMNEDRQKAAAIASLTQYMQEHHLRKTPERLAILEKVMSTDSHFTVDRLYDDLEGLGYHVSRATVYNTISLLLQTGLVRRYDFDSSPALYEKSLAAKSNSLRLICTVCGKTRDVKDAQPDTLLNSRRYGTFHPDYARLYVFGTCGRCLRRKKKAAIPQKAVSKSKTNRHNT